jgi:tRNA (adenine22-N1)-methyltransferase
LRSGLAKLGFGLESEQLITENNRYYELIEVSQRSTRLLTSTGNSMWDLNNASHKQYLKQLLTHYNKMLNKDELYYQKVITDYKKLSDA